MQSAATGAAVHLSGTPCLLAACPHVWVCTFVTDCTARLAGHVPRLSSSSNPSCGTHMPMPVPMIQTANCRRRAHIYLHHISLDSHASHLAAPKQQQQASPPHTQCAPPLLRYQAASCCEGVAASESEPVEAVCTTCLNITLQLILVLLPDLSCQNNLMVW